jgi:hypothetical protein
VNCNLEEKGVIKVQPETVCVALEHFTKCLFRLLTELAFVVKNQKDSGIKYNSFQNNNFHESLPPNETLVSKTFSRSDFSAESVE